MVMYRRKFIEIPVYQFLGSDYDWRRLIIDSTKNFKDVYLLDCKADRKVYPPEVKVINSYQTIKRINFVEVQKAAIFIGNVDYRKWLTWNWSSSSYVVLRTSFKYFIDITKDELLEQSSRKNIRFLRRYK